MVKQSTTEIAFSPLIQQGVKSIRGVLSRVAFQTWRRR